MVVDYVGRFESVEKDLKKLSNEIEVNGTLTKKRYSITDYKSFYTKELVKVVSDIYKRDLELFDYGF